MITRVELGMHTNRDSCFVAIDGIVYDVTNFLSSHPGGAKIVIDASGKDSSEIFHAFHKREVLHTVAAQYAIGRLENSNNSTHFIGSGVVGGQKYNFKQCSAAEVQELINIEQIAAESLKRLPPALGFGYINYGAEDEESIRANRLGWERYSMRPRVLKDVSRPDTSTTLLGGKINLAFPVCVSPFAGARATHPNGECAIAAAAAAAGTVYCVPHYAGMPLPHIADAYRKGAHRSGGGAEWAGSATGMMFQLYPIKKAGEVGEVDDATARLIKMGIRPSEGDAGLDFGYVSRLLSYIKEGGFEAVVLTVDVANNANRERTYKNPQWVLDIAEQCGGMPTASAFELAPHIGQASGHTAALDWADVAWLREETRAKGMCLLIKGVMTGEDTALAASAGLDGVIVSNHGR